MVLRTTPREIWKHLNNSDFLPNVAPRFDGDLNNGAAGKEHGSSLTPPFPSSSARPQLLLTLVPAPLRELVPAGAHLEVCAEVLVFLHHLQLVASPHQNRPHPSARQVGVELGRKYVDSS